VIAFNNTVTIQRATDEVFAYLAANTSLLRKYVF
jgi:hypothetical protein